MNENIVIFNAAMRCQQLQVAFQNRWSWHIYRSKSATWKHRKRLC